MELLSKNASFSIEAGFSLILMRSFLIQRIIPEGQEMFFHIIKNEIKVEFLIWTLSGTVVCSFGLNVSESNGKNKSLEEKFVKIPNPRFIDSPFTCWIFKNISLLGCFLRCS